MNWKALLLLSLPFVRGTAEENGYDPSEGGMPAVINLKKDPRWTEFQFGAAQTFAPTRFEFYNEETVCLQFTDMYCTGDQFFLFDRMKRLSSTKAPMPPSCIHPEITAKYAEGSMISGLFSFLRMPISKGFHNITVFVTQSPYEGGKASIRLLDDWECMNP